VHINDLLQVFCFKSSRVGGNVLICDNFFGSKTNLPCNLRYGMGICISNFDIPDCFFCNDVNEELIVMPGKELLIKPC